MMAAASFCGAHVMSISDPHSPVLLRFSNRIGLLGLLLLVLPSLAAALLYRGDTQSGFSFFNHTLSELGRYELSPLAIFVNGGLFFGGLSLIAAFSCRLWLARHHRIQVVMYLSNIVLAVSLATIGLFPINLSELHGQAMSTFYVMTMVCALLYCVALWRHPPSRFGIVPAVIAGGLGFGAFTSQERQLMLMDRYAYGLFGDNRPGFWWPAIESWLLLASVGIWLYFALQEYHRQFNSPWLGNRTD